MRLSLACIAAIASIALGNAPAEAQIAPPPLRSYVDGNGVDILSGTLHVATPAIAVGQPGSGLSYIRVWDSSQGAWRDNFAGGVNLDGGVYTVTLFGASMDFTLTGGVYSSTQNPEAKLEYDGVGAYTLTTGDGTVAVFAESLAGMLPTEANEGRVTQVTFPSGEVLSFTYTQLTGGGAPYAQRLQSVNTTLGYQIKLQYQSDAADATGLTLVRATALNSAIEYCSPSASSCSFANAWPTLTFAYPSGAQTVTDSLSRTWRYTMSGGAMTALRRPGSGVDNVTYSYSSGRVYQVSNGVGVWSYSYVPNGGNIEVNVVGPSDSRTIIVDATAGLVLSDSYGGVTRSFTYYATTNFLRRVTLPEGNYFEYAYDSRGNVTEQKAVAKPGSGLSDIVTTAAYEASCSNYRTCNQPNSITDPRGFRTDYTYDANHGGVLTVTSPAPSGSAPVGSGVRPQTRYSYGALSAWYIQAPGGSPAQAPSPIYRLTATSGCATTSSCTNGADETRTATTYGAPGGANNLLPTQVTTGAGNASLQVTTQAAYDAVGNVLTVDGPLSGSADTTRFRYDAMRQQVGIVGPDPDGGGALKHRALRIVYNGDGQPLSVERGTVNSQSEADWAAFVSLEQYNAAYDAAGRRVRESFAAGGATHAVTQYSYDAQNRLECSAVRMNPAAFASLPASACTLSVEGSAGPDRITRVNYEIWSRPAAAISGYGTALQQTSAAQTWTDNGQIATLTDANGHVTVYEYDGFDRLRRIRFPNASGSGASSTDYEQYSYDAASNVTQDRRRDGTSIAFSYDNLNRAILVDAPAGTPDIANTYDNFSRLTQSAYAGAHTLSFGYDQLSRTISAGGPLGAVSYQYDAASRRTRLTWPDAFYAQYDFDLTGAVTAIRENGAGSGVGVLATYSYDNLGRRTAIARAGGAGAATSYSYDAASRLSSLQQNLSGTSADVTLAMSYNAGSQALTRTMSNSAYAFTPSGASASYTANGLNQYESVAGASFTYDGRGNLTSDGARTYGYDAFNRLTGVSGSPSLALSYDPAGRLYESSASGTATRFLYDGATLIGEYNASGALQRRYVPGPGVDEPVLWYEGSGTSDRRWLLQDRIGSVIGAADAAGASLAAYAYDEYGRPNVWTGARLRYTGQMLLPEAQLYHYRARAYSPTLGRFLQTDPILYAGGMNLYEYVGDDPVNRTDPSGTLWNCWLETRAPEPEGDGIVGYASRRRCEWFTRGPNTLGSGPYFPGADREGNGGSDPQQGDPVNADMRPVCPTGPDIDIARGQVRIGSQFATVGLTATVLGTIAQRDPRTAIPGRALVAAGEATSTAGMAFTIVGGSFLASRGMYGDLIDSFVGGTLAPVMPMPFPVSDVGAFLTEQMLDETGITDSLNTCREG